MKYYFFYKTRHPFSQWHPCNFEENGIVFNCAEQYMMYHKALLFKDFEMSKLILKSKDPKEQKSLGRNVKNFNADIWNNKAKEIVYNGNYLKFTQNENLYNFILQIKEDEIVEASPYDTIWGIGLGENDEDRFDKSKWKGTNWLGIVLTKLRNNLKNA